MAEGSHEKYWRVRMKYNPTKDLSRAAWERNEVGIWYGAWSAEDLDLAFKNEKNQRPDDFLNQQVPAQARMAQVAWKISKDTVNMARRFKGISENDWVVACFDDAIHLARVEGSLRSDRDHDLNQKEFKSGEWELWKYYKVTHKKSFPLSSLPDFYRLIPQAGRSNVYTFDNNSRLAMERLAKCESVAEVIKGFEEMSIEEKLDFLGPKAWESFCEGYLILEKHFIPTGLTIGGTLKEFDMVGRNFKTGERILAQCKKYQSSMGIEPKFLEAVGKVKQENTKTYYFAYGGCEDAPSHIEVIDKKDIEQWLGTGDGRKYGDFFFKKND